MRRRLPTLRAAIALGALAVALLGLPRLWGSRFALERRAGLHLRRARAQASAGDGTAARAELRSALHLQPDLPDARRQLADLELSLGNWEVAFLELESLAEMHPESPEGFIGLAQIMVGRGWLEAPEAALDRALESAPGRADAHALRADLRFRLGRYRGARLDAEAALASAPAGSDIVRSAQLTLARASSAAAGKGQGDAPAPAPPRQRRADDQIDVSGLGAWMREAWPGRLGKFRDELEQGIRQKNWAGAQRIVESARGTYPGGAFPPYLAGVLELARGNLDEAERQLSEALAAAPRNRTVVVALAKLWSRKKDAGFAGDQLARLAERDPSFAFARYLAARAYIEARDPAHAEGALRRGLELQPDSAVPYQHLADYYSGLDRAPEAIGICQQGLDRFPRDLGLRMMLAQISAGTGRIGDAAGAYEAVLSARPDLDIVEYRLGMLLASQGPDGAPGPRAWQILSDLQGDRPSDPILVDVLGWLQFRAGNTRRARELLEAAVKDVPDEPRPRFHLAAVYAQEGRVAETRRELEAALGSGRPFAERLEAMRLLRESASPPAGRASGKK